MRLFIAIDLPAEIKATIETKMQNFGPHVRWTNPAQIHLTLHFLGEANSEKVENIIEALQKVKCEPFTLSFLSTGRFPLQGAPEIFWLNFDDTSLGYVALRELQSQIDTLLRKRHIHLDNRRYIPHLTMARLTPQFKPKMLQFLKEAFLALDGTSFPVNAFHLYKSELTEKRPVHTVLHSFPLNPNV